MTSVVTLCFLSPTSLGGVEVEFREDTDNTERKKRSREGQGTWGPGRPGMGKEEVGTQVAPSSRDGPLGVVLM